MWEGKQDTRLRRTPGRAAAEPGRLTRTMKIDIRFSRSDVGRVRDVVARMTNHSIVVERRRRNVDRRGIDLAHHTIWEKLVGCLLTTRQKSGEGSAVQRFIESKSPLLSLTRCDKAEDIAELAESELSAFGGIRRTIVIPRQIARNLKWLNAGGMEPD